MQACEEPGRFSVKGWATLNGILGSSSVDQPPGGGGSSDAIGKDPDQGRWVGEGAPLMVSGRAQHQFRYSHDTGHSQGVYTCSEVVCIHNLLLGQKLLQSIHILKSCGFMMSLGAIHMGVVCLSCSVEENWCAFPGTDFCWSFPKQLPTSPGCLPAACCLLPHCVTQSCGCRVCQCVLCLTLSPSSNTFHPCSNIHASCQVWHLVV